MQELVNCYLFGKCALLVSGDLDGTTRLISCALWLVVVLFTFTEGPILDDALFYWYFLLLKRTLKLIDKIQWDFLWDSTTNARKLYYVSWEMVTRPKRDDGLGIVKATSKNQALLDNISWRLFSHPSSPWARFLISRYSHYRSLFYHSFIWRNILRGWSICQQNMCWEIGDDRIINLWDFNWISRGITLRFLIQGPLTANDHDTTLATYRNDNLWIWDAFSFVFPDHIKYAMEKVYFPPYPSHADFPHWDRKANYSVISPSSNSPTPDSNFM
ncbi:hypothetical protein CQW23_28493 [Capsicum baccatum]|uniref:Reverse transcriptase zinc-binding domain-containing protein n=1 Tax=Capsicum baccatum TaxID=33114 RepID=A0A2G2VGP8_CAPBA|nr:hypothetical protein CQW23_28493 [Capsicum baccatum]